MSDRVQKRALSALSCLLPAMFALGCAVPADEGDPEVATAQEAFSSYWGYAWGTAGANGTYDIDLGLSSASTTCFLSSVGGNLASLVGVGDPHKPANAYAGVYVSGGHWHLMTVNAQRNDAVEVQASTICLPTAVNQILPSINTKWYGGQAAVLIGPALPNRVCGLASVSNTVYESLHDWGAWGDVAQVWSDGTNWWIGGGGNAEGTAVCVDKTPGTGVGYGWFGEGTNNLTQQIDHGTTPLGTQCFLNGISGTYRDSSSYTAGVYVNYTPSNHWWSLTVGPGKGAGVTCLH